MMSAKLIYYYHSLLVDLSWALQGLEVSGWIVRQVSVLGVLI